MDEQNLKIFELIKKILAEQLGIEPEDISADDSFRDDLHMSATDLTDFLQKLKEQGINISFFDLAEITTVADLTEAIISQGDIL